MTEEAKEKMEQAWRQCRDTELGDHDDRLCKISFTAGFDAGYAAASQWVRIEFAEDLPKEDGKYLVTIISPPYADNPDPKNYKVSELKFKVGKGWELYGMVVTSRSVVAWMPYPAPFQEEADAL